MSVKAEAPLALLDQFQTALELVASSNAIKTITTAKQYEDARTFYKTIIEYEKVLDEQYNDLEVVKQAKIAQSQKKDLAAKFDAAKKYLKNTLMLAFERAEEEKRLAEERRLAAIAKAEADKETARLVAEQKKIFEAAEKERKAAEALAAKAKGEAAKAAAEQAAKLAAEKAEQARQEALSIKEISEVTPTPVVVVERTAPSVSRRTVYNWRITTKDGRKFSKDDFKKVLRLRPADLKDGVPPNCYVLDATAISSIVDSMGVNANIAGVEVWESQV